MSNVQTFLLPGGGGGGTGVLTINTNAPSPGNNYDLIGIQNIVIAQGTYLSTIGLSLTYPGQTSIVTLGTVTTGTWNADVLLGLYGGTGLANAGLTIDLVSNAGLTKVLTSDASGNATWQDGTDFAFAYTSVNAGMSPYTVLSTDYYLSVDCSLGPVTLNFPNVPVSKTTWVIKDQTGSAATNNITVTTPFGIVLFDGSTSYVLDDKYEAVQMLANPSGAYEIF